MKRFQVEFSPEASTHVQLIDSWWRTNRLAAPDLFVRELAAALAHLRRGPHAGAPYDAPGAPPLRRILLPRTKYQLYYGIDVAAAIVRVHAVWHAFRGEAPPLPPAKK